MNGLPARRDVFTNVQAVVMNLLYENADAGEELLPMPSFVKRQKK
jgi:hydroxyethylthiazole kinase